MKYSLSYAAVAILAGVTLLSGLVDGRLTNRFGEPADLHAASERFKQLPEDFGDWRLQKREEMSDVVVNMLECAGYLNGSWINQVTGETVNAFIVLGPPGPISVHTPEVCYSSRDYDIREKRQRVSIGEPGEENEFWALTLRSSDVNANHLRVYYAWSVDGAWSAPDSPRFTYGGEPRLFKIQLASYVPPDADPEESDTCRRFLDALIPVVNPVLLQGGDT